MEIYEFTKERNPGSGSLSGAIIEDVRAKEEWFKEHFLSHGSIVGHAYDKYGVLQNQARCKSDILKGRHLGRHLNITLMRALVFCGSIYNRWNQLYSVEIANKYPKNTYTPHQFKMEELYRGLVYIYDKQEFKDKILDVHLAEYMDKAKDSKTMDKKDYSDPEEFLGEYYINERPHIKLIKPKFLVVGAIPCKTGPGDQCGIDFIWKRIKVYYPDTKIIYFPNLSIGISKPKGTTGNLKNSSTSIKINKAIQHVLTGEWRHDVKQYTI